MKRRWEAQGHSPAGPICIYAGTRICAGHRCAWACTTCAGSGSIAARNTARLCTARGTTCVSIARGTARSSTARVTYDSASSSHASLRRGTYRVPHARLRGLHGPGTRERLDNKLTGDLPNPPGGRRFVGLVYILFCSEILSIFMKGFTIRWIDMECLFQVLTQLGGCTKLN